MEHLRKVAHLFLEFGRVWWWASSKSVILFLNSKFCREKTNCGKCPGMACLCIFDTFTCFCYPSRNPLSCAGSLSAKRTIRPLTALKHFLKACGRGQQILSHPAPPMLKPALQISTSVQGSVNQLSFSKGAIQCTFTQYPRETMHA